jgi:preprotein translocase subunit SecB
MEINKILSQFQLLATSIRNFSFENDFVVYHDDESIEKELDVFYEINDITSDEEEKLLIGTISLYIDAVIKNENEQMKINLVIQGGFKSTVNDEDESLTEFRKLLSLNGCATLYSLARSIIVSFTSQSCLGGNILLPMINVFKLKESLETK